MPRIPHSLLHQRRESQPLQSRSTPKDLATAPLYLPAFSDSRLDLDRRCPADWQNIANSALYIYTEKDLVVSSPFLLLHVYHLFSR